MSRIVPVVAGHGEPSILTNVIKINGKNVRQILNYDSVEQGQLDLIEKGVAKLIENKYIFLVYPDKKVAGINKLMESFNAE